MSLRTCEAGVERGEENASVSPTFGSQYTQESIMWEGTQRDRKVKR